MFPSSGVIKPSINAAIANNTRDIDNNMIACFNFIVQEFSGFFKPGMNCTFSGLVSIFFMWMG